VISQSGSLDGIKIIRDIGGGCGQAVVNVLKKLQSWSPGSQNNMNVNVKMTIPVKFKLE
jgi:protein TonB